MKEAVGRVLLREEMQLLNLTSSLFRGETLER